GYRLPVRGNAFSSQVAQMESSPYRSNPRRSTRIIVWALLEPERSHALDFIFAADDERGAFVHRSRLFVENTLLAVGRQSARLFRDEGQRIGFVEQPQLALRRIRRGRIEEDTAADECPVKIRHERPDVTQAVTSRFGRLDPIEVTLDAFGEFPAIG